MNRPRKRSHSRLQTLTSAFLPLLIGIPVTKASASGFGEEETILAESVAESLSETRILPEAPPWASLRRLGLNFASTVFGPSASQPSNPFQPEIPGVPEDFQRPVLIRSVTTLSYAISETRGLRTNLSWDWTPTDTSPQLVLRDPQLHFYEASIASAGPFNWYGDLRLIPALTPSARDEGLVGGVQTFHVLSLASDSTRWSANTFFSLRWNVLKSRILGDDLQTFTAPHVAYSFSERFSSSLQLELTGGHRLGDPGDLFFLDPVYLVPGFEWTPTPAVSVEPYFSIPVSRDSSLRNTALGLSLSWTLL